MKKQWSKRIPALLLTLALLLSLLPLSALAEGDITVTVTVENSTYSDGTVWEGNLLTGEQTSVTLPAGSTMLAAVTTALDNAGKTYAESGGYISTIEGLTAGAAGGWDGWVGALNGVVPGMGLNYVYLNDGDTVRVLYADAYGDTSGYGVSWSSYNGTSGGFSFSGGVFSYAEGGYGTELTLTLPADAAQVAVTAVPNPNDETVRIYEYNSSSYTTGLTAYSLGDPILLDGSFDMLTIAVGDAAANTYGVALKTVDTASASGLMENIAATYASDVSDYWYILGVQAYGSATSRYDAAHRQSYVDAAVAALTDDTSSVTTLAMHILALRSLGYDPAQLVDADGAAGNAYDILSAAVAAAASVGIEGRAYSLLAWLHADDPTVYASQIDTAVAALTSAQEEGGYWDGGWGYYADTSASAVLALSLADQMGYAAAGDTISKAADYLKGQILADGTVPGDNNGTDGNANTTAMAAMALKAAGEEPSTLTESGSTNTLLQGLLLFATGDNSGFIYSNSYNNTYNNYATKQAFLGLIAATKPAGSAYHCFDFTENAAVEAATSTAPEGCPVTVSGVPADASVEVKLGDAVQTPVSAGRYDLATGSYTYTASKSGYETGYGSFSVTAAEATNHTAKSVTFTLSADETVTEYLYLTVRGPSCTLYSRHAMAWVSGMTPLSALQNTGLTVISSGGYVSSIAGIAEFDYGSGSGWLYQVNGDTGILDPADTYSLDAGDELVWYYTIDYTSEDSSEGWSETGTETAGTETMPIVYQDVSEDDPYYESICWAVQNNLFRGVSETDFAPGDAMTRGMLATVLRRLSGAETGSDGSAADSHFSDVPGGAWYLDAVNWAVENNLMDGYGNGMFGSDEALTNEQLAVILWRYTGCPAPDSLDSESAAGISVWAFDAMAWAAEHHLFSGTDGAIPEPGTTLTRAETADILMRFVETLK